MIDRMADRAGEMLENIGQRLQNEDTYSKLYVEPPKGSGWFGFGKKVVVPSDQIHIVAAAGLHSLFASREELVYGADTVTTTGERRTAGIIYRKNSLTNVIAMRTVTFLVAVNGVNGKGVNVLDSNHVPYTVSAHVVAKLDETKADIAAKRVGKDIDSLVTTIREVTEAELADAAASMMLSEVLKKAQVLAEVARQKVDETLQELGYTLVLLKVSDLGGDAYQKLVAQANAEVLRSSTIEINRSELATAQNNQERQRTEATVQAETLRVTEKQRLEAQRDVDTTSMATKEELAERQHELTLIQATREQAAAQSKQGVQLKQVQLDQEVDLAQTSRKATVAAREQELADQNALAAATAEAQRLALIQEKELERQAESTAATLKLKAEEESAAADRARAVALTRAQAEADSLKVKTDAETSTALLRAERSADAATKEAAAEKLRAEATRASAAAAGLAEADVQARQVEIEAKRVDVTREQGLAEVAVLEAKNAAELTHQEGLRKIEIDAQQTLAALYQSNPALVELERLKIQLAHELQVSQIEYQARVSMMAALAPHMNLHLIGDGGRVSQIMAQVMTLGAGLQAAGEHVPFVGNLINGATNGTGDTAVGTLQSVLGGLAPYISKVVGGMQPRVFSTLTVSQMIDHLVPVLKGEENLLAAVDGLRRSAQFRLIADLPVAPFLNGYGVSAAAETPDDSVLAQ